MKAGRAFEAAHADDWIVISALRSDHHPVMIEVIATRGGKREHDVDHFSSYHGPSSFAVWQARKARRALLLWMEGARCQTQRQLDLIDWQILRSMTALIPSVGRCRSA